MDCGCSGQEASGGANESGVYVARPPAPGECPRWILPYCDSYMYAQGHLLLHVDLVRSRPRPRLAWTWRRRLGLTLARSRRRGESARRASWLATAARAAGTASPVAAIDVIIIHSFHRDASCFSSHSHSWPSKAEHGVEFCDHTASSPAAPTTSHVAECGGSVGTSQLDATPGNGGRVTVAWLANSSRLPLSRTGEPGPASIVKFCAVVAVMQDGRPGKRGETSVGAACKLSIINVTTRPCLAAVAKGRRRAVGICPDEFRPQTRRDVQN